MGELFAHGESTETIMRMTYSEMAYWQDWIELIAKAKKDAS